MQKQAGKEYKHLVMFGANLILLLLEAGLFAGVWILCYLPEVSASFFRYGNFIVVGMYTLILFLFVHAMNGNRIGYLRITEMWLSQVIALAAATVVIYAQICLIAGTYVSPLPLVVMDAGLAVLLLFWIYLVRVIYLRLYPPRDMLVVYERIYPEELIAKINLSKDEFHSCRTVSTQVERKVLRDTVLKADAVILSDLPDETRNTLVKFCYRYGIRTYVTPKISDLILRGAENVQLFYTPLFLARNHGLTIEQRFVKRTFDLVVAMLMFLFCSPLLIVSALAIKLCDGGPVFYRQERLTRDGKPFLMIKFRSMYVDAERSGPRLATKEDPRVTPVGKILRRLHIDELPQLINVLKGEMSIVGPRPERKEIAEKYAQKIPEFSYRLKVKAGLTGYAQVNGKYNSTPYDKLKLDVTYMEQYSLWLDVKILLWTVKVLFQKENTEGIDEEQTTAIR